VSISYLITLYNKEAFIGPVMDAVLAEHAETGGEVIVYDDVSTDRSVKIAQQSIAAHPGQASAVQIVRGTVNGGLGFATNELVKRAAFPYTHLVDADDILVPGSNAAMLRLMKENNLGHIFGNMADAGVNDHGLESQRYEQCFILHNALRVILRHTVAGPSPSIYVTEELRKCFPLPPWVRYTQDFPIGMRMANRGVRIGYVKETVAIRPRYTGDNLSTSLAAMFAEMTRDVVHDADSLKLADLRYVTRRHARRAAKYLRRRGQNPLNFRDRLDLWRGQNLSLIAPRQACVEWLGRTAALLERERYVVVTEPTA